MRLKCSVEKPGTDCPGTRRCVPEERNPRLRDLGGVPDTRFYLSVNMTVTVLMSEDTISLSPELLQTPLNMTAKFYSYVRVLKSRYFVGAPYRLVSYTSEVNTHILFAAAFKSSMCVKIRHLGHFRQTACLPTGFLAVLLNPCVACGYASSRAEIFCCEVS